MQINKVAINSLSQYFIIIKETGQYQRIYMIGLTENDLFNIVINFNNGDTVEEEFCTSQ